MKANEDRIVNAPKVKKADEAMKKLEAEAKALMDMHTSSIVRNNSLSKI
jgi:hypothetical protein